MNHQPHSAAEAANLITDWLTDDELSDEEEDQQEDENLSSVVDAARQRQDRRLLSSSSDSYESSESRIRIQIFPILLLDQMLMVLQHI